MNPVSPFLFLPALATVLVTTALFLKFSGRKVPEVTFQPIDGLRGYLAFFVFIHHCAIWYFYLKTTIWAEPDSHLFIQMGQMSVSFFFMITGFLFFNKLINGKVHPIDWVRLFVSRILRLYPVYMIATASMLIIIGFLTQWHLREPRANVFFEVLQWGTFTVIGRPDVNQAPYMVNITADVVWSLVYEWVFYLSLPLIGFLFFRSKVNFFIILATVSLLIKLLRVTPLPLIHYYSFGCGLIALLVTKQTKVRLVLSRKIFTFLAILSVVITIWIFSSPYQVLPLTLIAFSFIIVAAGNNFFGLLNHPVSRMMGQISYPLYLLHPLCLFILFKFLLGFHRAAALNIPAYWMLISLAAATIIMVCYFIHYRIELPAMRATTFVTRVIRRLLFLFGLTSKKPPSSQNIPRSL